MNARHLMAVWMSLALGAASVSGCSTFQPQARVVNGIHIPATPFTDDAHLTQLINQALTAEPQAWAQLIRYDCGGGSFCYDLGYILSQLVYRVGEEKMLVVVQHLNQLEKFLWADLLRAGLEYGDQNNDSVQDNRRIETEFPALQRALAAD